MNSNKGHKNIKKKLLHGFLWVILGFLYIPVSLTFLSNQPLFQTFSAKMATDFLSNYTGYRFNIKSISISLWDGIEAGGLALYDHHDSVMIKIGRLCVKPVYADYKIYGIIAQSVKLDSLDFRLGTYKDEENLNLIRFINSLSDTTTPPSGNIFKLKIKQIEITNSHFEKFSCNDTLGNGKAIDYSNMIFDDINLKIDHFKLYDDSLNFKVVSLSTREKCGLTINNLQMDFILSGTTISGKNLKGKLNHSKLDADVELNYRNWGQMGSFLDSVQLYGKFRKTALYLSDIGYFADVMFPMKDSVVFTGTVTGTVEDFLAKNLIIDFGKQTHIDGDFRFSKIVEYHETQIDADIRNLSTAYCDVKAFKLTGGNIINLPENYNCDDIISLNGTFKGNYFDFKTDLSLMVDNKPLSTSVTFRYIENDTVQLTSTLNGQELMLGHLFGLEDYFGSGNIAGTITGSGHSFDDISMDAGLTLSNLQILDYWYDSVFVNGIYHKKNITGKLRVHDNNLILSLNGDIHLSETPQYKAKAKILKADLKALNLIEGNFSFATTANLTVKGNSLKDMYADLNFENSLLILNDSDYMIKSINLKKYDSANRQVIALQSDYLDGKVSGNYNLATVSNDIIKLINNYFFIEQESNLSSDSTNSLYLTANIKNDKLFEEQFLPGFTIENGSRLSAALNFKNNTVSAKFTSPFMAYKSVRFKNNTVSVKTRQGKLLVNAGFDHVVLKDSTADDPQQIGMDNFTINSSVYQNVIDFGIFWNNNDTTHKDLGKIRGYLYQKDDQTELIFDNVKVYVQDTLWSIDKNNSIITNREGLHFNNVTINGGASKLSIQGTLPKSDGDSLEVRFSHWDLSNFDVALKNSGIDFDGFINGSLELNMINNNRTLISDFRIIDFGLNNVKLGDARLMNTWNNIDKSVFIKAQIIRKGKAGVGKVFSLDGFYFPFKEEDGLQLHADFNRINIALLNPFMKNLFHDIRGRGEGYFDISGTLSKPVITGKAELLRAELVVNYLNTKYSFSNYLEFKPNEISFDNIVIYDTLGNKGLISGSLRHNYFDNFHYDIRVNTDKLLFINTNRKMNKLYYGSAIASGNIHLWGGPGTIQLDAHAETVKGTDLNIPLDYVYDVSDNDYIVFIPPPVDTLFADSLMQAEKKEMSREEELKQKEAEEALKYDIKLNTNITPEAKVNIFLPSELGNIESQGHGKLDITANSNGVFSIIGDYVVNTGYFNFNFKNLVSKRFDLVKGGKISWTGDPTGAIINIKGLYKVKTNVSSLGVVIDSTASYKNKVMVYCYVTLSNTLLDPTMRFSFDLPDADPDLKRLIFASLDTTNISVVNEQMISLLVLGSFNYSNAGNVNLASSGYNILANQLSSMLSKMSDKFDIGVNYKVGDEVSQQEFEVALSTQLFNDRLNISGNFGMTYDQAQKNASNIVGDVDISYKLTRDGRWLLKAFNHSNMNSWYYYNNYDKISPYTQGVGVAYRKEFDNIHELFGNKRKKKNKETEKQ